MTNICRHARSGQAVRPDAEGTEYLRQIPDKWEERIIGMANIYKRSGVWHVYYRQGGKRIRYSLETRNARVAKDLLKKIEYELMSGQHVRPQKTPVVDFLADFLAHLKNTLSYRHYRNRRSHLRSTFGDILPELADHARGTKGVRLPTPSFQRIVISCRFLQDITPSILARYLNDAARLRNWAPHSCNRARETLHSMFEYRDDEFFFLKIRQAFPGNGS
jgi:hypothetical protein